MPECQILDRGYRNAYEAGFAYVPSASFGGYGDSAVVELDGRTDFLHFDEVLMAEVDAELRGGLTYFTESAGPLRLPDALLFLGADNAWTWRNVNGMGLRLRVSPELRCENSGINGEALFVPASLVWTWPFDRSASTLLGVAVRPGYRRTVYPLLGVEWEAAPAVRVRVGFPETKLLWLARPEWRLYAGLNWRSDTYDLNDESRYGRDALTVEDYRLAAGVSHSLSEQLQVFAELGGFLKRDYLFEGGQREYGEGSEAGEVSNTVEADKKLYLRVGLAGPF